MVQELYTVVTAKEFINRYKANYCEVNARAKSPFRNPGAELFPGSERETFPSSSYFIPQFILGA